MKTMIVLIYQVSVTTLKNVLTFHLILLKNKKKSLFKSKLERLTLNSIALEKTNKDFPKTSTITPNMTNGLKT